ncbi:unnamed protein product [Didymodactylos carnosus]|uniref:Uncharacterized protein n=1 Tax=Didymodactylos carnosus TaxID=1234261 RepID=A0A8S2DE48_9BILA|nr:unnamed protein product [Didymodactylos carnosus]CAF3658750.1 unnamed protein product [Didymodactylos carnosus]
MSNSHGIDDNRLNLNNDNSTMIDDIELDNIFDDSEQEVKQQESTLLSQQQEEWNYLKEDLHFLLTFQSIFYISEAAIKYVGANLADVLEWLLTHQHIDYEFYT